MSDNKRHAWRMSTPRWWRNVTTNRPLRRQAQRVARRAVKLGTDIDLHEEEQEELDLPSKVRPYYW